MIHTAGAVGSYSLWCDRQQSLECAATTHFTLYTKRMCFLCVFFADPDGNFGVSYGAEYYHDLQYSEYFADLAEKYLPENTPADHGQIWGSLIPSKLLMCSTLGIALLRARLAESSSCSCASKYFIGETVSEDTTHPMFLSPSRIPRLCTMCTLLRPNRVPSKYTLIPLATGPLVHTTTGVLFRVHLTCRCCCVSAGAQLHPPRGFFFRHGDVLPQTQRIRDQGKVAETIGDK